MAGYLGTKAVFLSTTAASVTGDATIGGDLTIGSNALFVDESAGNVGIGTSLPDARITVDAGTEATAFKSYWSNGGNLSVFTVEHSSDLVTLNSFNAGDALAFGTTGTERMRLDSSGNLLVGKTSSNSTLEGFEARSSGLMIGTVDGNYPLQLRRLTSDGTIIDFRKDSTTQGVIQVTNNRMALASGNCGIFFDGGGSLSVWPWKESATSSGDADNSIDLGDAANRWDDVYATNGTIQTSDRNEKQDIEALSDAEQRVAVACKGLLRKFRWKDAVAEKGEDARIHFGIIAQDLQDAFAAEGLDAGRYAMFISSTWWETQTDVPAVEADEENGIEAKDAYTRTDTYETLEEAPAGATERTRLGVRYPELLAFIIGAM